MQLGELEFAAEIVYAICRNHPELCPHSHEWAWSDVKKEDGTREAHYRCRLCGHEEIRIEKGY